MKDEFVVKKLSKMICYHTSEWGLDYNSLQSEIETLLDEGIKKEKNADKKNKLNQKKELTLSNTKQKVEELQFWSKVKVAIPNSISKIPDDCIYDPIRNQSRRRFFWEPNLGNNQEEEEEKEKEKEEEEEHTPFPISPKVYHFHPIAFVEQMKRVGGCFCDRDLTEEEVENIIKKLRDSENDTINDYSLFSRKTDIPNSDKTFIKFTKLLNETFKKFNINTCIRKIHFLTQAYLESNRFRSSREEGSLEYLTSKDYYPFYGRGLMQLTWKGNTGSGHTGYKQYFDFLEKTDYSTNYEQVNSDINLVFDSAGWFWERGKVLNNNNPGIWKAPNFSGTVGDAVAKEKASVRKTILTYGKNNTEYGVINLNLLADNDFGNTISWLVNGGGNGFQKRRNYLKELKKIRGQ